MRTRINGKLYELKKCHQFGDFYLEFEIVCDPYIPYGYRRHHSPDDFIAIGIGRLRDYEITERIESDLKDYFEEKSFELQDKLRYLDNEQEKKSYVQAVAEQFTRDYITDFIEIPLSKRIYKAIVAEAEDYFTEIASDTWEALRRETEDKFNERLEKLPLEYDELTTLKDLYEICKDRIDNETDALEIREWKQRKENLETILERVI